MDIVSFHYEISVQKWKYVFQRRIAAERDLGKEAFECIEISELLKVARLIKVVGPCHKKAGQ